MALQLVEVPKIVVGLAVSSGGVGSSGPERETRLTDAAVEVSVGEARYRDRIRSRRVFW